MEPKPPLTPAADLESAAAQSKPALSRKKLAAIVVLTILFSTTAIAALDLTLFKVRRPNYRLRKISVGNLIVNNSTNSPSFRMDLDAEISFRNRNFGPYEYQFGYLTFSYMGIRIGDALVDGSSVKMYSSRSLNLRANVTSQSVGERSNLRRDIASGGLMLNVKSELRGQVKVMKILPKDRGVELDCNFMVDLGNKSVQELTCS